MDVKIMKESGYEEAIKGLSLSYNVSWVRAEKASVKLAHKDGGHNKFLESICVWLDINAPLYWWKQFDTYRIGVTKQSESTMHTLMKKELTTYHFEKGMVSIDALDELNSAIECGDFDTANAFLPQSFLQRRIVCTNYKALRGIYSQRKHHKLGEWLVFCNALVDLENYYLFLEE